MAPRRRRRCGRRRCRRGSQLTGGAFWNKIGNMIKSGAAKFANWAFKNPEEFGRKLVNTSIATGRTIAKLTGKTNGLTRRRRPVGRTGGRVRRRGGGRRVCRRCRRDAGLWDSLARRG